MKAVYVGLVFELPDDVVPPQGVWDSEALKQAVAAFGEVMKNHNGRCIGLCSEIRDVAKVAQ